MSGPKDYSYVFSPALAALLESQLRAIQRERARAHKRRMEAASERARERVEKLLAERAQSHRRRIADDSAKSREKVEQILAKRTQATQEILDERRRRSKAEKTPRRQPKEGEAAREVFGLKFEIIDRIATARENLAELAVIVGNEDGNPELSALEAELDTLETAPPEDAAGSSQVDDLIDRIALIRGKADKQAATLVDYLSEIATWQAALAEDEDVQGFQREQYKKWCKVASQQLVESETPQTLEGARKAAAETISQAKKIHDLATELKAKFHTRNELLTKIIGALRNAGFFVADPHFADTSDPIGPVVIKASKGGEDMTTWVDLSDEIRSHWNQTEAEHCKDTFFEFVDAMQAQGVHVHPKRTDLRERPNLKRKGAKDLPTPSEEQQGN